MIHRKTCVTRKIRIITEYSILVMYNYNSSKQGRELNPNIFLPYSHIALTHQFSIYFGMDME
jgi:hypothetical protein